MALPGVSVSVLNGQLGLQQPSAAQTMVYLGCCTDGTAGELTFFNDASTAQDELGSGELLEAIAYHLANGGGPVGAMPLTPTTVGGVSSVTHVGTGAATMTVLTAPHVSILVTCTTGGTLGTAEFTFSLDGGAASTAVTSASGWSSTGYLVPGTFCTIVFTAGTYITGGSADTYTISTIGVITHATGAGPAVPTYTASPIDWYTPTLTITTAGALATSQFTYSLDGSDANVSAPVLTVASGKYALPGAGVYVTFSGTAVADDTYAFTAAGPLASNTELTTEVGVLETTYLSSSYSMGCVVGNLSSTANWATQVSTLATAAGVLFDAGLYTRWITGCPSVGTITGNAGSVTVNSASTDAAIQTQRLTTSTPFAAGCAGDVDLTSAVSGLTFRRNCSWVAAARAAAIEPSQNIGFVGLGSTAGVTDLYRNEQSTPALDAVGFITMRTFPGNGLAGFYLTDGHTLDTVVSDYYPLTNARVMDRACTLARTASLPLINSKIPTKAGGVITEKKAQQIDAKVGGALLTGMVDTDPQDAVAASASCSRTHNILADGNLIIGVSVQPFAYARTITLNIGLAVTA